jgi:hypothetical protein
VSPAYSLSLQSAVPPLQPRQPDQNFDSTLNHSSGGADENVSGGVAVATGPWLRHFHEERAAISFHSDVAIMEQGIGGGDTRMSKVERGLTRAGSSSD